MQMIKKAMEKSSQKSTWSVTKAKLYKNITYSKKHKKERWWRWEHLKALTKLYQHSSVVENQQLSLNHNFY